jgi:hypothetical protein
MRTACLKSLFVMLALYLPATALAAHVQVPIPLNQPFLEALVREQAFATPNGRLRLNDDGSGCQFLELGDPRVETAPGRVVLRTVAQARAGRSVGGRCLLVLNWHGQLEFTQNPLVSDDGRRVLLRTSSWRALKPDGQPDSLSTTIGRWLEQYLPLGIRETRIDLGAALDQLDAFLASVVVSEPGETATAVAIDSVRATAEQVVVTLGMDVPLAEPPPTRQEPELDAAEIARLEAQLDQLDAFFTYAVRSLAASSVPDPDALLDVMVSLRLELVSVLSEPRQRAVDPARDLFVQAWDGLVPVLRLVAEEQLDPVSALRYLSFISGGDALKALDALGPAAGLVISTDGLRRLARMLLPDDPADPLARSDAVDPTLRRVLGFGAPLPPPERYVPTSWIDWFIPRAVASAGLDPAVAERLNLPAHGPGRAAPCYRRAATFERARPCVSRPLSAAGARHGLAGELLAPVHGKG